MTQSLLANLDSRLASFSDKLRDDLGIPSPSSATLATAIRNEIRAIDSQLLPTFAEPLSLKDRFVELNQLLSWLEETSSFPNQYGQVLSLNYICFVYLGDACFKVLKKQLSSTSITHKCCAFLTDNPVRAFRNALAHGNWKLLEDRSGIDFWAKKGSDPNDPLVRFRFSQDNLFFAQYLAIATAYASMLVL